MFYPGFPAKVEFPIEEVGTGFMSSVLERFKHSVCKTLVITLFSRRWMNTDCFVGKMVPAGCWILSGLEQQNLYFPLFLGDLVE